MINCRVNFSDEEQQQLVLYFTLGITPLHFACGIGPEQLVDEGTESVKYLLASGADVNLITSRQDTPLHWASKFSNAEVVQLLLQYKSNVNAINHLQYTPLCGRRRTKRRKQFN